MEQYVIQFLRMMPLTISRTRQFLQDLNDTFESISQLPIPTIAAINGHALGGGLELALNTTFRVAHETAKLGLPETRLGIIPGAGGTYNLPRVIGTQKAMHMILTGTIFSGQKVVDIGLADVLAQSTESGDSRAETVEVAIKLAEQICEGGPIAIQQAMNAVKLQSPMAEINAYEVVLATEDRMAALKAFAAKKPVEFTGH
jgi:methylglutaconyl-CoA hydratase